MDIEQILNNLLAHEISKHETIIELSELFKKTLPSNFIEMKAGYVDEENGIVHLKRNYNTPGIKGLKTGDKILVIKKP